MGLCPRGELLKGSPAILAPRAQSGTLGNCLLGYKTQLLFCWCCVCLVLPEVTCNKAECSGEEGLVLPSLHTFRDSSWQCATCHHVLGKPVEECVPFPGAADGAEALSRALGPVGSHSQYWAAHQGAWFAQEEHGHCKLGCAQPALERNPCH